MYYYYYYYSITTTILMLLPLLLDLAGFSEGAQMTGYVQIAKIDYALKGNALTHSLTHSLTLLHTHPLTH